MVKGGAKKRAQEGHAIRRAQERYGIRLDKTDLARIANDIRRGKAEFIEKQSLRVKVYRVEIKPGLFAPAVYDKTRHQVVTFLEWEHLDRARQLLARTA